MNTHSASTFTYGLVIAAMLFASIAGQAMAKPDTSKASDSAKFQQIQQEPAPEPTLSKFGFYFRWQPRIELGAYRTISLPKTGRFAQSH